MIKALIILALVYPLFFSTSDASESKDCVILLHGLGRTHNAMNNIEQALVNEGYFVWNKSYPSTSEKIEILAVDHINKGLDACDQYEYARVHFVTHSLGGILVRYYLQENIIQHLGKIVMLSPPNHGSEVVDLLRDNFLFKNIIGPAGQQLGTDPNSLPNNFHPVDATIGIITGQSTSDPWFSPFITGEDDGKVSVESAKLAEMTDFLVVESGHTFIMNNDEVIRQIAFFLKKGEFDKMEKKN